MNPDSNLKMIQADEQMVSLESLRENLEADMIRAEPGQEQVTEQMQAQMRAVRDDVGMEGLEFQDIKNMFSSAGDVAVASGRAFMNFLDAVHRMVDSTYLVTTQHMRKRANEVKVKTDAPVGTMERPKLVAKLVINGKLPSNLDGATNELIDFAGRTVNGPISSMALVARRISGRLEAKRWMGNDAFNDEVDNLSSIIASQKAPMAQYAPADFGYHAPGDRVFFRHVRPSRPKREPQGVNTAGRRVVEAVAQTTVAINKNAHVPAVSEVRAELPVLTPSQIIDLMDTTDKLLREIVRIQGQVKQYKGDAVPSSISLMISGLYHGVSRTLYNFFASEEDGFGEIDAPSGGGHNHVVRKDDPNIRFSDPLNMNLGLLSRGDDDEQKELLAVWVSRYLKLSVVDHQLTSKVLLKMMLAVAKSYIEYAEESLRYYEPR